MADDLGLAAVFEEIARRMASGLAVWERTADDASPSSFVLRFANDAAHGDLPLPQRPRPGATLTHAFEASLASELASRFASALALGNDALAPAEGGSGLGEPPRRLVALAPHFVAVLWDSPQHDARSAEELRATNIFLDSIVENLPAMIFLKDATHLRFERFNRAGEELIGRKRDELLGKSDYDFFPPEQAAFFQEKDRETLRSRAVLDIPEEPLQTAGGVRWLHTKKIPILDDEGEPVHLLGIAMDITARKAADDELRKAREELEARVEERTRALQESALEALQASVRAEEANRIKDQFLATVSHELRTPLTAILGWSSILSERPKLDPALLAKGLSVIQRNAQAQARLVDDILDVSRVMTGKLRIEPTTIDVVTILKEAMDSLRPSALAKALTLELRVVGAVGSFFADPERLRQVAWNLLSNAVKFTPPHGRVMVEVSRGIGELTLKVRDTGVGIDAEFLPYVFDRFRQADGSTTRSHGGLGLGLAIVRHLVELHGGHVTVESDGLGTGTSFMVVLPAQRSQRTPSPVTPPHQPRHRGRDLEGKRILVVDDEPDARDLIGAVLDGEGAAVRLAGSGAEALSLLEVFRPTIVISDLGMPGQDGFDLLRSIRAVKSVSPLRAVAVTAFARPEDEQAALRAGFDAYLAKPLEPEALISLLRDL